MKHWYEYWYVVYRHGYDCIGCVGKWIEHPWNPYGTSMVKIHQGNSPSHDLHVDLFNTYSINTALAAQAAIICNVSRSKNVRTWRWIWRHDWRIRTVWHYNRLTVMVTTCNHHVCTRLAGSGTYRRDFKGIKKVQIKPWSCACWIRTVEHCWVSTGSAMTGHAFMAPKHFRSF